MSIKDGVYTAGELNPWVDVVTLEDYSADVLELKKDVYSLRQELATLMSSLEAWDEEFK